MATHAGKDLPFVSIIIVNLNGWQMLEECLTAVEALDYPRDLYEVIVVDNGSSDGSPALIRKRFPWVRLLENAENQGFAKPNNDAAKVARGEYLALLNNDAIPERNWLKELVTTVRRTGAECAGSVMLNRDGTMIDFIEGNLTSFGHGTQLMFGYPVDEMPARYTEDPEILFACGGAMLIQRDIFLGTGGFDEDYFAYFEDVDLGWRLWILGYRVVLSHRARVKHKHNSTSKKMSRERLMLLYERNALTTIYKNYGEERVHQLLNGALLFTVRRALTVSQVDVGQFAISQTEPLDGSMSQLSIAYLAAIDDFLEALRKHKAKRDWIQRNRKRSDEEIRKLIFDPFQVVFIEPAAKSAFRILVEALDLESVMDAQYRSRVVLVAPDTVGVKMAGPGIRYWEMSKALADHVHVTLVVPNKPELSDPRIVCLDARDEHLFRRAVNEANVIVVMGAALEKYPFLKEGNAHLVVDLYDPFVLENLEVHRSLPVSKREELHDNDLKVLLEQVRAGDYFICASPIQRDLWVGLMMGLNFINPQEYEKDRGLKHLLDVVPFGLSEESPVHTRRVLKGVIPGIAETDKVIIWGGGIWNWFDPLTLIRAMSEIAAERSDIKLFFMGTRAPSPDVPEMEMARQAVQLAQDLDLLDRFVFFNEGWIPYGERQNYLLEADIGVSCHFSTLETRFSFRTRILDYIWANLPIVTTEGDFFAEITKEGKLGLVVPCEDQIALKDAILSLLDNPEHMERCRERVGAVRPQFSWKQAVQPLAEYCMNPVARPGKNYLVNDFFTPDAPMTPVGELLGGMTVGQIFPVSRDNLTRIDILVATYARKNQGRLRMRLKNGPDGAVLVSQEIRVESIKDNTWVQFEFPPIPHSGGSSLYLELDSPESVPGNAVTVWTVPTNAPGTHLYINGLSQQGTVRLRAFTSKMRGKETTTVTTPARAASITTERAGAGQSYGDDKLRQIEGQITELNRNVQGLVTNVTNINAWIQHKNHWLDRLRRNPIARLARKVLGK